MAHRKRKQRFSEVIRRTANGPQEILRRDRLVAAVLSAADYADCLRWAREHRTRSLDEVFDEVRELAAEFDYELEIEPRQDRFVDSSLSD